MSDQQAPEVDAPMEYTRAKEIVETVQKHGINSEEVGLDRDLNVPNIVEALCVVSVHGTHQGKTVGAPPVTEPTKPAEEKVTGGFKKETTSPPTSDEPSQV